MTPPDIQAMDGPTLTRLACALGLAPAGTEEWEDEPYDFAARTSWQPHVDASQAYAVFRHLRTLGYSTSQLWLGDDRQYGEAWASRDGRQAWSMRWQVPAEEACALVRCAVLAVASAEAS